MKVVGDYVMTSLFSKSDGPYTVILRNVCVQGNATLAVNRDGHIEMDDIKMDITFAEMSMDFQNLGESRNQIYQCKQCLEHSFAGFLGNIFQGIVNSAPNMVFDLMKPYIMKEAYTNIKEQVDTNIAQLSNNRSFVNSVSPLDMAISELRRLVRDKGFDPYHLTPYSRANGMYNMEMSNTWVAGLSSFYRVGDIIVLIENNTVGVTLQLGTQQLTGSSQWVVSIGSGMITRTGHVVFTVQHVKASVEVEQPLDTRKKLQIRNLDMELGNIQVRVHLMEYWNLHKWYFFFRFDVMEPVH